MRIYEESNLTDGKGFQQEILEQIKNFIESIKFGQVIIIVQDSKVIQIDKIEKVRLK